ncbi:penicillin acylase family protein [Luteimonas sp. SX5]|uniref:Penicillin acylase family protein n=1 Tax=Luteimonas galliterrae TaxID=2940486 RepID=A0ABT0MF06_9GAMM|nr:penicillin acylase family protein [Luteimonas galliterrae]MCL1633178.1 penicillin acylase family protein [Luteimonas galliterrae]
MAKWLKRIGLMLLVLILLSALVAWWLLRGSLPKLDGELALRGLSAPATIRRDELGVVTIDAANEMDAMRALGYVHAQERYFEMDLLRRTAAGELSELFGPIAIETDKRHRLHRFRARLKEHLDAFAGNKAPVLQAYTDGVNAGLQDLDARPWPYLLLGQEPKPWTPSDSALTGYAMYFDLQESDGKREMARWRIKQYVPDALYGLIFREGTSWDAPLVGEPRGDAVLPPATEIDLRKLPAPRRTRDFVTDEKPFDGSNNFAVSGKLTADGRAIVADDMHLGLRAPGIWFRARLRYADPRAAGGKVDVSGFTLPGLPAVVVGSNGHVAWAFTNSYTRTSAVARLRACDKIGPEAGLLAPPACATSHAETETILVAGADPVRFRVEETQWGPVFFRTASGTRFALKWTAHEPGNLNMHLSELATATDAADATRIASRARIPAQNFVVGDRSGNIAWTLIGRPLQADFLSGQPALDYPLFYREARIAHTSSTDFSVSGAIMADDPALQPIVQDRLWTANARTLDGELLAQAGDGGYDLGARAKQIRDGLFAKDRFTERDLLAIQLDDRALFLQRWHALLQAQSARARTPALRELAAAAAQWQGRASADSASYRIVRAWRLAVLARIADGLTAPAQAALGDLFEMPSMPQLEGTAWPLVTQRPVHLLSRRYASWDALLEDAAKEVRDGLQAQGPLSGRTWGERNTAAICHPLARAIPLLGEKLLCMPPDPLPGDSAMPRVQGPTFGASERMVVSPGHEADGIVHMPGGQSGHFLSPFWGAGHENWVHGRPTPFLPGEAEYTLKLEPAR